MANTLGKVVLTRGTSHTASHFSVKLEWLLLHFWLEISARCMIQYTLMNAICFLAPERKEVVPCFWFERNLCQNICVLCWGRTCSRNLVDKLEAKIICLSWITDPTKGKLRSELVSFLVQRHYVWVVLSQQAEGCWSVFNIKMIKTHKNCWDTNQNHLKDVGVGW